MTRAPIPAPLLIALLLGCQRPDPEIQRAYELMGIDRAVSEPPGMLITAHPPPPPSGPEDHQQRMDGYAQAEALIRAEEGERPDASDVRVARGVHSVLMAREPIQMDTHQRSQLNQRAFDSFEAALAAAPKDRDASWGLLMAHMLQDCVEPEPCLEAARGVLAWDADNALALYAETRSLYVQDRLDEAVPKMEALVRQPGFDAFVERKSFVLQRLAEVYQQRGDEAGLEALKAHAHDIVTEIESGDAYYRGCPYQALGALYRVTGEVDRATALEDRANLVDTEPLREALTGVVQAMDRGDLAQAAASMPALPPDVAELKADEPVYLAIAARTLALEALVLASRQRWEQARAAIQAAAEAQPGLPIERVAHGHLALGQQQPDRARADFEAALAMPDPTLPGAGEGELEAIAACDALGLRMAQLGLAWIAANDADYAGAMVHYDAVISASTGDRLARQGKAVAHIALGELEQAQALLEGLLEEWPEDPYARAELGIVHLNRGDLSGARQSFEQAMTDGGPTYSCPYEGLGLVMLRQGDASGAQDMLEEAIRINPDLEYKKYNALARIEIEAGNLDRARLLLVKSIENFPHDDEAQALLHEIGGPPTPAPPDPGN